MWHELSGRAHDSWHILVGLAENAKVSLVRLASWGRLTKPRKNPRKLKKVEKTSHNPRLSRKRLAGWLLKRGCGTGRKRLRKKSFGVEKTVS